MNDVEVLTNARALVAKNWSHGPPEPGHDIHCAVTAIHEFYDCLAEKGRDYSGPCAIFAKAAGLSGFADIADWNDHPDRTQLEVIAAFDKAIAIAEGRAE